jgi:two-component system, cell cycle sensor histidine kinase and response regulator CckA
MKAFKTYALRYGIGVAAFIGCLILALTLQYFSIKIDQGLLIVAALAVAAWYGGTGPGLMVAILIELVSMVAAKPQQESMPVRIFAEVNRTAVLMIISLLISARRNAERRLRDQRELLQVTLSSIDNAVIATELTGIVTFMNPAAEAMTGWTLQEATGRPLDEVFQLVGERSVEDHSKTPDVIVRSQDGTTRQIEFSKAPIRDKANRTTGSVLVFRDVTERKLLQDQFRQAQKMEGIGRLAGGVAHDFNNLLTVILGYCDLAFTKAVNNINLSADLKEIKSAGERAAVLVSQLLAFSRKQVLQPRVLDLNEIVDSSEKMLRRLIGEDVDLVSNTRSGLGHVQGDPGQIEQIILNLAVNARDAMPEGGKLMIETANVELDENYARTHAEVVPGRYVLLAVSDTGHGMDAATQGRIFEPFFTTKELGKGTGLGLSTVFGIVKQSGGHIWLYSEPGKGATFKVYLPIVDEPVESSEDAAPIAASLRGSETILLTEDDEAVRGLAETILETYGYHVLVAASGSEAIEISKRAPEIALLITDVIMPGMSGRELASAMEKMAPHVRTLYLSGYAENAVVHHGVLDKGVAFLPKPFTPDAFARKVREVLDRPAGDIM